MHKALYSWRRIWILLNTLKRHLSRVPDSRIYIRYAKRRRGKMSYSGNVPVTMTSFAKIFANNTRKKDPGSVRACGMIRITVPSPCIAPVLITKQFWTWTGSLFI